ncbi:flagellar hook-associated protein FlgK [Terriglobus roseus]|uniref:Flagellar hook-associated protein 1 n=1 Tax=Terriglobus roseus TaxID=392734 RepID=A0A1H4ITZ4_9BACT|nr:flagellar hook-associated protein FlgK [Terriglobus roseus]SEB36768.1 flagellar hook-associated protein 1 FlgK [Terriglobus roseus]
MLEMPTASAIERYLSLNTQQMKLTAANMANQNTDGYTRRTVSWGSGDTVSVGGAVSSTGVTATIVAQRDRVLLRSVQTATEADSASSARVAALNNLQALFAIGATGEDASGIGAAVSDFFNAATSLSATPNDGAARQSMLTAAQTLASVMNQTAAQITSQSSAMNQTIADSVTQVNTLAATVAALNKQISGLGTGEVSDALVDQRDLAVTHLAKLMDVNSIRNGDGSVSLALSNGIPLVNGSTALPLTTGTVNDSTQIFASSAAGGADVTAAIHGGSIGGSLQVRDSDIPAVMAQLDTLAGTLASAVNAQNILGTDAVGNTGGPIFSGSTAATLTVVATDANAIAASPDGSNAAAIGALQDTALMGGGTFAGAFSTMLSGLGTTAADATTGRAADAAVLTQTTTQMDAISGVSLDTEAANLTQFQRSYEAAAKVMSIVNELMAQAINLGTPTAVS